MPAEIRDHNVFILGAGFSRDAGAPLIHDFLDRSREFFDDPDSALDEHERHQFGEVFRFKREVAKAREKFRIDLDDIEQLFGLVEMSHRLGTVESATRDATVYLIAKTLQLALHGTSGRADVRFTLKPGYGGQADSFLKYVRRSASGGDSFETDIYTHFALYLCGKYDDQRKAGVRSNTAITFNYDLVLDDALRRVEANPGYELQDARYEEMKVGYPVVPLLKLHGSTNWAICKCNQIHVLEEKATSDPSTFRSMPCRKCGEPGLRLLLVPPSWDKSEYSEVMRPVWRKAVEAIQTATRICVIGYSMPEADAFFKFLLTLGLAENDHLYKLVVVDLLHPDTPNNIEVRWREMLEGVFVSRRFVFNPRGTSQFMQGALTYDLRRAEQIG